MAAGNQGWWGLKPQQRKHCLPRTPGKRPLEARERAPSRLITH